MLLASVLALLLATAAFFVGRHSSATRGTSAVASPPPMTAVAPPSAGERLESRARQLPPIPLPLPATPPASADDASAREEAVRSHRAEILLDDVFRALEFHARTGVKLAEIRADTVLPYLSGILHGALQADPAMRTAFSAQFTSALCERTLAEDQSISVAHMAMLLPDISTKRGFDCFFTKTKEGVPLWTMLDAWRRSGLEKTPVLANLQASSTDSRVIRSQSVEKRTLR